MRCKFACTHVVVCELSAFGMFLFLYPDVYYVYAMYACMCTPVSSQQKQPCMHVLGLSKQLSASACEGYSFLYIRGKATIEATETTASVKVSAIA